MGLLPRPPRPFPGPASLTGGGFADGGVLGADLVALHAQAVEAAVRVDAALRARVGGGALVHVDARLPVIFQLEAGVTAALWGRKRGGVWCWRARCGGFRPSLP